MSKEVVYARSVGVSWTSIAAILAVCKVANILNISWLWVFAPMWLPLLMFASIVTALGVGLLCLTLFAIIADRL